MSAAQSAALVSHGLHGPHHGILPAGILEWEPCSCLFDINSVAAELREGQLRSDSLAAPHRRPLTARKARGQ